MGRASRKTVDQAKILDAVVGACGELREVFAGLGDDLRAKAEQIVAGMEGMILRSGAGEGRAIARKESEKPPKPFDGFPLFAHSRGYWAKSIDGKHESFGQWDWPDREGYEKSWRAALKKYHKHVEDIALGRSVKSKPERLTLETLVDAFLSHKHAQADAKEIGARMFYENKKTLTHFRDAIGRAMRIVELEDRPTELGAYLATVDSESGWHYYNKRVTLIRGMFKWAADPLVGLLDRPFKLSGLLKKKGENVLRKQIRQRNADEGRKMIPGSELLAMLAIAKPTMQAKILLGYFCAFGNTDCADLPINAINFEPDAAIGLPAGWGEIIFPRPKTEIERAAVIPPVLVNLLKVAIARRPKPAHPRWRSLVFLTKGGLPFVREAVHRDEEGVIDIPVHIDAINLMYRKLRDKIRTCKDRHEYISDKEAKGCPVCKEPIAAIRRLGFYAIRHTAITDAAGCTDIDALTRWQGHSLPGMRRHYVEQVEAPKLKMIAECLQNKLYGKLAVAVEIIQSASGSAAGESGTEAASVSGTLVDGGPSREVPTAG